MKCILLVLFVFLSLARAAPALELELDSNGDVIPSSSTVQIFVSVVNKMDKTIQLYWDAPGSNEAEDIHMFDIEAKQTQGLFSFNEFSSFFLSSSFFFFFPH